MSNQKGAIPLAIPIVIAAALIGAVAFGYFYWLPNEKENNNASQPSAETNTNQLLGGDEDEYGCKGSAGYSWCESKQKCLRVWEEECPEATNANVSTNTNTSAEETVGWETYTNEDLGISFKYPNSVEVKSYSNCADGCLHIISKTDPYKDDSIYTDAFGPGTIGITRFASYESDLEEFANSMVGGFLQAGESVFAGNNAYRIYGVLEGVYSPLSDFEDATTDNFFVNKNDHTWQMKYIAATKDINEEPSYESFLNILSTFQFTDETANLKTYNSADGTLSFEYPQDWYISGETLLNGVYSWQMTNYDISKAVAQGGLDNGMIKADFSIYPNSDNKTTETIISCENNEPDYISVISCNTVTINNRLYKKRIQDSQIMGSHRSIQLGAVANNKKYFITGMVPAGDQQSSALENLEAVFATLAIE